ncbi:hypothetical protein [Undibacterium sp. Tian12W]|uniref:hypothetical protein n=1 Tax=Undibacterium sp. Tian12W TaxID=3413054 RepID=UPI003BEF5157
MLELEWKGVPLEHSKKWQDIFQLSPPSEGMHLAAACPVCGANSLFRYFALGRAEPREIQGIKVKGSGSYWEWCSRCRSFEHMSVWVPEWWQVDPLKIDHEKLTARPDLLDAAVAAA